MTALDYFVLIVLAAFLVAGAAKGIIKGVISVAFAVAGIVAAANFYPFSAATLGWLTSNERLAQLLGFAAILLLSIAAGSALTFALRSVLKRVGLGWIDHTLGAALGLLRGCLICSAVYFGLTAFPLRLEMVERAKTAPMLLEGTRAITFLGSDELRRRFRDGYEAVRREWDKQSRPDGGATLRGERK